MDLKVDVLDRILIASNEARAFFEKAVVDSHPRTSAQWQGQFDSLCTSGTTSLQTHLSWTAGDREFPYSCFHVPYLIMRQIFVNTKASWFFSFSEIEVLARLGS